MKIVLFLIVCLFQVWAAPPIQVDEAETCTTSNCSIENNCRCSTVTNPIQSDTDPAPQLIAITVSESVVNTVFNNYLRPLFFYRYNPDGGPVGITFYVNHEYTDYGLVNDLYRNGFEIGVHSITKNSSQLYWRLASKEDLVEEFLGQRQILSRFASIPIEDITGARTPQLQIEGDLTIDAYIESGLSYDNSWPTRSNKLLFPYTLDYKSTQECMLTITCPTEPHEGFWIAPITNIHGYDNVECNSLATCLIEGSADEIATWLLDQVNRIRTSNRAPIVLRLDAYWFSFIENSYDGFVKFLDAIEKWDDTFLVTVQDVLNWTKNPVSAKNFRSSVHNRPASCSYSTCVLEFGGETRYMGACGTCPKVYPWKGNPYGELNP